MRRGEGKEGFLEKLETGYTKKGGKKIAVGCLKGFYPTNFLTAGRKGNWQALFWQVVVA